MIFDSWLERWLSLIAERAGDRPVLEIGCGNGQDTRTLSDAGLQLIAFDRSEKAVARARQRAPRARISCQDLREPFPTDGTAPGVVVASLSLHYFAWDETVAVIARIRASLHARGLLVCRLNSTEDRHFGARGHAQIAEDYYLVDGQPKRFFDRTAIERLFADEWTIVSCEHRRTRKYLLPKALWEVVVERGD